MTPLQKHVFVQECKQWLREVIVLLSLTWLLCSSLFLAMQAILDTSFSSIGWKALGISCLFLVFPAQMMMPMPRSEDELEEWLFDYVNLEGSTNASSAPRITS